MVNLSFKELDFLNLIEFSKKVPQYEVLSDCRQNSNYKFI